MKNHPFFFCIPVFTVIFTASPGCIRKDPARSIRLLATPALAAQGGFLQAMKGAFKKESGCTLDIQEAEGASGVISILSSPKEAERVDAVIGIDEMVFDRVRSHLETSAQPDPRILPLLSKRIQPGFVPLHYSPLSMIYRKAALKENALPHRLSDLLKPALKKKFILQDPRASTPGMMFFLFASSLSVRDLRARWSALVPGWDASYKRFLEGEAPMVWSYLSSLAYHA
ncbi:MAG: hypothetical protein EBX52_09180, partial [Proteobacteria bacterium]|nr:hypothetical protein [Pseudomonadota bacterium]